MRNIADEFYINANLSTEIPLPMERGTLIHYFDQVRKRYPTMRNFYSRDRDFILEEDKDLGNYRWTMVEYEQVGSGWSNPPSPAEAMEFHRFLFELFPYTLNISSFECEFINLMFGFDFTYFGNHHELLAEALGFCPGFEGLRSAGAKLISHEYILTLALDNDCRTQARVHVEPRTTAYQVRHDSYSDEPLSIYLNIRRYGGIDPQESFSAVLDRLYERGREIVETYLVDNLLLPIQQAIAIK